TRENQSEGTSIPGDAFEAFVGALYLDKGYRFTYRIITQKIMQNHLDLDQLINKEVNFKSKLIEWSQKMKREIEFKVVEELENNKKMKIYVVELLIDLEPVSRGKDFSIKKAEQMAAEIAFSKINREDGFLASGIKDENSDDGN
ncbi:MAG: putative dsRNA-binding protein, partial [Bacteroidota bacterium]